MTPALAVDVGTVRVGVAGADATGTIATPLQTIPRTPRERFWHALLGLIDERRPERVVVGLPRLLRGGEGSAAEDARRVAAEIGRRTGLPVDLWDERFTTVAAERSLIAAGVRRERRRATVDSVAAALLLQSWLDARSGARVP